MCDSFVAITADGVMFAKNSDRDPNESQPWSGCRRADHAAATGACTWIEVPQVDAYPRRADLTTVVDVGGGDRR